MIASLRGTVVKVALDRAVLEVGGVGYVVLATPATLSGLTVGAQACVATSMVLRDDSVTLYAFADDDERSLFETVQTVSGVGPRLALAMLAVHTPDAIRRAVMDEDIAALVRVPGIGRKGAQRIVLELSGKLGAPVGGPEADGQPPVADQRDQVVAALVGLGWNAKAAEDAVESVAVAAGAAVIAEEDVAPALRAALRLLGGHHA